MAHCLRGAYVLINDYSLAKTNDLLTEYFRNFEIKLKFFISNYLQHE